MDILRLLLFALPGRNSLKAELLQEQEIPATWMLSCQGAQGSAVASVRYQIPALQVCKRCRFSLTMLLARFSPKSSPIAGKRHFTLWQSSEITTPGEQTECLAGADDLKARTGSGANPEEWLLPAKPQTPFPAPSLLLLLISLPLASFVKASKGLAQDNSLEV